MSMQILAEFSEESLFFFEDAVLVSLLSSFSSGNGLFIKACFLLSAGCWNSADWVYHGIPMVYPIRCIPPKWIQNGDNNRDTDDWPLDTTRFRGTLFCDKPKSCIGSARLTNLLDVFHLCQNSIDPASANDNCLQDKTLELFVGICSFVHDPFTSLFNQSQTTKHTKLIQTALHAFAPVHLSLQLSCQDQLEEHHSLETMTEADHRPARCS